MSRNFNPEPDGVALSRKLLGQYTVIGRFLHGLEADTLAPRPKHGERAVKSRAHKRRRRVLARRLRRVSLCSFATQVAEAERRTA